MSDRPYPKILRTTEAADALLRAYAAEYGIKPFEALVVAIDRLADPVESETLRASLDAAGKIAERLAADLESAREATRRADQALESSHRSNRILAGRADAAEAEVARLTRELALERDAAARAARLGAMREEERDAARSELSEARAALETKGATDRLAERLETIAVDVDRRACACALPDDLAPRLAAIAARRDVEPHVMLANVIKNGISKIEASDKYQDAQKAARART